MFTFSAKCYCLCHIIMVKYSDIWFTKTHKSYFILLTHFIHYLDWNIKLYRYKYVYKSTVTFLCLFWRLKTFNGDVSWWCAFPLKGLWLPVCNWYNKAEIVYKLKVQWGILFIYFNLETLKQLGKKWLMQMGQFQKCQVCTDHCRFHIYLQKRFINWSILGSSVGIDKLLKRFGFLPFKTSILFMTLWTCSIEHEMWLHLIDLFACMSKTEEKPNNRNARTAGFPWQLHCRFNQTVSRESDIYWNGAWKHCTCYSSIMPLFCTFIESE